ncbi:uncharacterized protein LOC144468711 [Augochlora pura]
MASKFQFTYAEEENLVDQVGKYPVLYDRFTRDFNNKIVKEDVWIEISNRVGRSPADCKRRWRNIRDTYLKLKRGRKYGTGSVVQPRSKWPLLKHLSFLNNVWFRRSAYNNRMPLPAELKEIVWLPETTISTSSTETSADTLTDMTMDTSVNQTPSIHMSYLHSSSDHKGSLDAANNPATEHTQDHDKMLEIFRGRSVDGERSIESLKKTNEDNDPTLTFFKSMAMVVRTFSPNLIVEAKREVFNIIHELELRSIRENANYQFDPINTLTKL